jgi:transcriptional regulator with XRE-family HTH domain
MSTFGKRLRTCREAKSLSQQEVATLLNTSYTVIGKYERDEMIPSVEVAKKLSKLLDTTVGYLLGETEEVNLLKDPSMLKRLDEINNLPEEEKKSILSTVDAFLRDAKARKTYA